MRRTQRLVLGLAAWTALVARISLTAFTAEARPEHPRFDSPQKGAPIVLADTVGIRLTVSNVDPTLRSADFDLTMYTRGLGPLIGPSTAFAGALFFTTTYPAIDYGDGSVLTSATLGLTNSGGGPGGSSVYRTLASFTHTYPAGTTNATFIARTAMNCVACFRSSYVFFPTGSPPPATFTQTTDLVPPNVIGRFAGTLAYSGTTTTTSGEPTTTTSVRYKFTYYPVVTNTAVVSFLKVIPTASEWGLITFGAVLLVAGLVLMRRLG